MLIDDKQLEDLAISPRIVFSHSFQPQYSALAISPSSLGYISITILIVDLIKITHHYFLTQVVSDLNFFNLKCSEEQTKFLQVTIIAVVISTFYIKSQFNLFLER